MRVQLHFLALIVASASVFACGGDDTTTDTGTPDTGSDGDTDTGVADSGTDTGTDTGTDAGAGCTEDCNFVDVVGGATHSCALRANGEVWCWGGDLYGTLGDGPRRHMDCGNEGTSAIQFCSYIAVKALHIDDATHLSARSGIQSCALRESGGTWCWGQQSVPPATGGEAPELFEPEPRAGLENLETLSDGFGHTCGIVAGQAVCIGRNQSGQIATGDRIDVRAAHTIPTPTDLVDVQASANSDFTCALSADAAYCWGNNRNGQLGDGVDDHGGGCLSGDDPYDCSLTPVEVSLPDGVVFTQIAPGGSHVCAVGDDANLYCWGANGYGQLGLGDQLARDFPTAVTDTGDVTSVVTGGSFTCFMRDSGAVLCFGDNELGSLGDGMENHADCAAEVGSTDCSHTPVAVSTVTDAVALAAGARHACVIRTSDEVVCWGNNRKRQLGVEDLEPSFTPVVVEFLGD